MAYAIGQLGWSILINIIGTWLVYFYLPPKEAGLPILIMDTAIFVIFNVIGLVSAVGRLWDAVTDPYIANKSDMANTRWGRRVPFLAVGALPAAFFCALVFMPPDSSVSTLNLAWMIGALLLFYLFLTIYVTPYFALIPELGHNPTERLNISTYISVTYFLGIAIAAQAPNIWNTLMDEQTLGLSKVAAIQWTLGILCFFALICMYFPVFAINEKKYCESIPSTIPFKESLILTFKNKSFLVFALSDFAYFLSLTILQSGLIYYVTILLSKEDKLSGTLFVVMGVFSFILYPIVNLLAKKVGKKPMVILGLFVFLSVFVFVFFLGFSWMPIPPIVQAYLIVIVAAIPMAILGILPNAILADIAELDGIKTGSKREGLFYAGRTFMQKAGQTIGILIFSSLLLLGRDAADPMGIRLTGPAAAIFCFLAILFFSKYDEKNTLKEIETSKQK
ncbi:MAG: MFS transporter [Leptospiraceae bacterium]|nr:MFS transporter [Leptospiraceae bacterium]MCP5498044.1 MFS transporter [Leptospiraceae bacterium]